MTWVSRLILIASVVLLGLYALADVWYLRAAYGIAVALLLIYFAQVATEPRYQLLTQQREIDRLTQVCEQLDENTKLIVQTDLELTRTQEELDRKIRGLTTLHALSQRLIAIQSIPSLLALMTEALVTRWGFEKGLAVLVAPAGGGLEGQAQFGYSREEAAVLQWTAVAEALRPALLTDGQPLLAPAVAEGPGLPQRVGTLCSVTSLAVVPILSKGRPAGFILVGSNPPYDPVAQGDVELLATLASEAAVAIDNIRLYDEIRRSHQELEARVRERTQELAQANDELRRLNKMKSDFVSAVSHELKTPLTSIKGYASVLMTGKLGAVTAEQRERLLKIDHHTNDLTSLITDLLDIARLESGRVGLEFTPVALAAVLDGARGLIAPQLTERGITLEVALPARLPTLSADPRYLERVFLNLFSNALRVTPPRGTIRVSAVPADGALTVQVQDTGTGIAPQDLPKIFEEFYRADTPINRERKGAGLGLSLVRRIIEAHGGQIGVESTVGRGTTFTFTLPLTRPATTGPVRLF